MATFYRITQAWDEGYLLYSWTSYTLSGQICPLYKILDTDTLLSAQQELYDVHSVVSTAGRLVGL